MIAFTGFPNISLLNSEIKTDFTIEIIHNFEISYKKELNNKLDNDELIMIVREIRAFIDMNKSDKEMFLSNLIEFLIWFDKKTNGQYLEIHHMIYECAIYSKKIDFVSFLIHHKDDLDKYQLNFLVDEIWEDDLYFDFKLISDIKSLCNLYNFNYKERMLYIFKRYVNETTLNIINKNFDDLLEEDLMHIIIYSKNINSIKTEYKRLCAVKEIVDELVKENKE